MKNEISLGLIIADDNEFEPIEQYCKKYGGKETDLYGKKAYEFVIGGSVKILAVLSGVGKVNAAETAALMAVGKPDYIISVGLSGGISHISRGEITVCNKFVEHDFDLTPLGYEKGVKPGQEYIYYADDRLIKLFTDTYPSVKIGAAVTGDCFVCDDELRKSLADKYDAMSCDMETAAVASVCRNFNIGFTALRKVSDDAGDDAHSDYHSAKGNIEKSLTDVLFECIEKLA